MTTEEWIRAHGLVPYRGMCNLLEIALRQQRQMCAKNASYAVEDYLGGDVFAAKLIETACLNATREE